MHIVVDTSVARAAGESDKQSAKACRDSLEAIRQRNHYRLAMNTTLKDEWQKTRAEGTPYASRFAIAWLTDMTAQGRVTMFPERSDLQARCLQVSNQTAIQKDLHLVDLALQANQRVLSMDKRVVGHLRQLGARVPAICAILWCIRLTTTRRPGSPRARRRATTAASAER